MKRIAWEEPTKKSEAHAYLAKVFKVTKPAVSLALSFKRNSPQAIRMRNMAIQELGGKLLSDENVEVRPVKVLDSKGNVKSVLMN